MKNKGYAKFWWANKVHYGKCASGVYYFCGIPVFISGEEILDIFKLYINKLIIPSLTGLNVGDGILSGAA